MGVPFLFAGSPLSAFFSFIPGKTKNQLRRRFVGLHSFYDPLSPVSHSSASGVR
jgi:hypothetical protein